MRDDENAPKTMTGADALVAVAVASGVEVCFANPGTSEMHLVGALARRPDELKSVLVLHENIASGAADGFARARKRTGGRAMTLLHCYVGLANALSNSHNASRGRSPVVNVVGDTSTFHRGRGALLDNDVEALARTVCEHGGVVRDCSVPESIPMNVVDAFEASARRRAVSCVVVPHDASWSDVPMDAVRDAVERAEKAREDEMTSDGRVSDSIRAFLRDMLTRAKSRAPGDEALFYVGGDATGEEELRLVREVADAINADVVCECFFSAIERGGDLPRVTRAPYFPKDAAAMFDRYKVVCFVDVPKPPVAMFGYRDGPSTLFNQPDDDVWIIDAPPRTKIVNILRALRDEIAGGERAASDVAQGVRDVVLDVLTREENDFDESASFWSQGMTKGGDASGKVVSRIRREIELDRRLRSQHVVVARRARGGETWRGVVFVVFVSVSDRNDETLDSHESEIFARRSGIAARRRVDGGERVRRRRRVSTRRLPRRRRISHLWFDVLERERVFTAIHAHHSHRRFHRVRSRRERGRRRRRAGETRRRPRRRRFGALRHSSTLDAGERRTRRRHRRHEQRQVSDS